MAMEYRTFPRGGERASVIGFGMGSIHEAADDRAIEEALCSRGWAVDKREYQHFDPYPYIQTIYIVTTVG